VALGWTVIVVGGIIAVVGILNIIFRRRIAAFQNTYRPSPLQARTITKVIGSTILLVIAAILIFGGIASVIVHSR
jgi:hypothetical protein